MVTLSAEERYTWILSLHFNSIMVAPQVEDSSGVSGFMHLRSHVSFVCTQENGAHYTLFVLLCSFIWIKSQQHLIAISSYIMWWVTYHTTQDMARASYVYPLDSATYASHKRHYNEIILCHS